MKSPDLTSAAPFEALTPTEFENAVRRVLTSCEAAAQQRFEADKNLAALGFCSLNLVRWADESVMSLRESITSILSDTSLDDDHDSRDSSRTEELEKLISIFGWDSLELEMLDVLRTSDQRDHWNVAAGFFWAAVLDKQPIQRDRLIAHLCYRLTPSDDLAWSIISKLKDVPYDSDYDPLRDAAVISSLETLGREPQR